MSSAAAKNGKRKGETLEFKSPAEFFAENQNIAGFDNAGKALYTTIREFVENALDAAESAGRLPDITVTVEEMDAKTFNRLRGEMHGIGPKSEAVGAAPAAKRKKATTADDSVADAEIDGTTADDQNGEAADGTVAAGPKKGAAIATKKKEELSYYRITCRDNGESGCCVVPVRCVSVRTYELDLMIALRLMGDFCLFMSSVAGCGMPHAQIPEFLGRVLAGSKYGVRQTRGKFGLGAKMALIWSKKSTGLPIEVKTAHGPPSTSSAAAAARALSGGATAGASSAGSGAWSASQSTSVGGAGGGADSAVSSLTAGSASPALFGRPLGFAGAAAAAGGVALHGVGAGAGAGSSSGIAGAGAGRAAAAPAKVSLCRLDIDIYRNQPQVLLHTQAANSEGWVGTQISVVISGAWSSYRARVRQYFQQLAVITPYAQFTLHFAQRNGISLSSFYACSGFPPPASASAAAGGAGGVATAGDLPPAGRHDFTEVWRRRSTQVPPPPREVKHHPSAVNDLLLQQLMDAASRSRGGSSAAGGAGASSSSSASSSPTVLTFLTGQFQSIDKATAQAIAAAAGIAPDAHVGAFSAKEVHALRVAMEATTFPPPAGSCLSPAGEYNLRLGIMKELRPDLVATATSPVGVFQGHPFVVEAGVALGGRASAEGLVVHRFANRIPLLFEGGGDVATQTATKRINWSYYKIDPARDRVAVFVSLVSTKIPFKGTGKEYIGDDIAEVRDAVKEAVAACCGQLRVKLQRAAEARERASRRKNLTRYIPDVTRALMGNLKAVLARAQERGIDVGAGAAAALAGAGAGASLAAVPASAADALDSGEADAADAALTDAVAGAATTSTAAVAAVRARRARATLLRDFAGGRVTESVLSRRLEEAVERADMEAAMEQAAAAAAGLLSGGAAGAGAKAAAAAAARPLFIAPLSQVSATGLPLLHHPVCVLKLLPGALLPHVAGTFALPTSAARGAGRASSTSKQAAAASSAVASAARSGGLDDGAVGSGATAASAVISLDESALSV